ncbi:MAG: TQO small subunit DoxD [Planctomycetota bacterium]
MYQLSRIQFIIIFVSLMLLRVGVGYHFYTEGTTKLESGKFTSKYFLAGAKGPFAPLFTNMIEDADSSQRLCVKKIEIEGESTRFEIDHNLTELLWNDLLNEATEAYDLGSPELQKELAEKRVALADRIKEARETNDTSVDTKDLERQRSVLEQKILRLRTQREDGEEILQSHIAELVDWLSYNEVELLGHFRNEDRLEGFQQDGENRDQAAVYVESLRWQVDTIRGDRNKDLAKWNSQMAAMWDSFERKIQELPIEEQIDKGGVVSAHRPFDEEYSFYKIVDKIIPWFDTIIGVSLILGLFARVSSLAAGAFLLSVVMSQPPWIPGTDPKAILYAVEMLACGVIFATGAGRMGGLDYFLNPALYNNDAQESGEVDAVPDSAEPATA